MPNISIDTLKMRFSTGNKPTEEDFHNLIDTLITGGISAGEALSLLSPRQTVLGLNTTHAVSAAGVAAYVSDKIASYSEARSASSNTKIMTPKRTRESITYYNAREHYTKPQINDFFQGEVAGKKTVAWENVAGKPSTFIPSDDSISPSKLQNDSVTPDALAEDYEPILFRHYEREGIVRNATKIVIGIEIEGGAANFNRPLAIYDLKVIGGGGYYFHMLIHLHRISSNPPEIILTPCHINYQGQDRANKIDISLDGKTSSRYRTVGTLTEEKEKWYQNIFIGNTNNNVQSANLHPFQEGYYFMLRRLEGDLIKSTSIASFIVTSPRSLILMPLPPKTLEFTLAPGENSQALTISFRAYGYQSTFISGLTITGSAFSLSSTIPSQVAPAGVYTLTITYRRPRGRVSAVSMGSFQFNHNASNIPSPAIYTLKGYRL